MKKNKSPLSSVLKWFAAVIAVGGLALLISPPPARHLPEAIHVAVTSPPLSEPAAGVGDEAAQPSVSVPVAPEPGEIAPGQKPRIAIVIDDVGLDIKGSERAIELPAYVTLSFLPYAPRLKEMAADARGEGHELLLHMPMEPVGHSNPGPGALLVDLPPEEIRQRFDTALASFTGFDGVNNHMGSKFTAWQPGMEIVIEELQQRHLFFLDSRTSAQSVGESTAKSHQLPTVARDIFLDDDMSIDAVRKQLAETERVARHKGSALAIGHPHAAALQALWEGLPEAKKRGFVFVPVRAFITQPKGP